MGADAEFVAQVADFVFHALVVLAGVSSLIGAFALIIVTLMDRSDYGTWPWSPEACEHREARRQESMLKALKKQLDIETQARVVRAKVEEMKRQREAGER